MGYGRTAKSAAPPRRAVWGLDGHRFGFDEKRFKRRCKIFFRRRWTEVDPRVNGSSQLGLFDSAGLGQRVLGVKASLG